VQQNVASRAEFIAWLSMLLHDLQQLVYTMTTSPNFAQILRKCLKRLNTRKICSHNERNKSLDVESSADSNRSTWTLGRFFSCAAMPKAAPKA
jgi:hypothetical protein